MIPAGVLMLLLAAEKAAADTPQIVAPKTLAASKIIAPKKVAAAARTAQDEDLTPEQESLAAFAKVRRIYVDILTGGESALRIRDLLMSGIQASKLFIVTEEEDKADAVLKGAGRDEAFTETHQSSDSLDAHSNVGRSSSEGGVYSRSSSGLNAGMGVGENESQRSEERKHEALATVRLVNKDGDVIWSATEESLGAKFAGASVDVVERITKKLAADYRRAKAGQTPGSPVTPN